jgi:hypothetical protein
MLDHSDFGLLVYSTPIARATDRLNDLLPNDAEQCGGYRLLPPTALGSGLCVPNEHEGQLNRTIFLYTAVLAVRLTEMTAGEMTRIRREEIRERFW